MIIRQTSLLDRFVSEFDTVVRTLAPPQKRSCLRDPAANIVDQAMTPSEKKHVAGLMRVNHAGEVCAQALYQGQSLTAKLPEVREQMTQAALEEVEHLSWCEQRLQELGSAPSRLNFFWYGGSLAIGLFAGLVSDRVSLGFVAETERQVTAHLHEHLQRLPSQDVRSKAILSQMKIDEERHEQIARDAGAYAFPAGVQWLMQKISKGMTATAYRI